MKQMRWAILAGLLSTNAGLHAAVKTQDWGTTPSGQSVKLYTLDDGKLHVELTEYGARLVRLDAPDRNGKMADVVLGYSSLAPYATNPKDYFGPIVGRFGNRIAKGTYTLEGTTYHSPLNNGANTLHGGPEGFSTKVWTGRIVGPNAVEFTYVSPDGEMGYPGQLTAHVTYTLAGDRLKLNYSATTTKPTVVNLTNHSFWNLAGEGNGNTLQQTFKIDANRYTPVDSTLIPTGQLAPVAGTPFDFRQPTPIGAHIHDNDQQLQFGGGGYDHNFVLNGQMGVLHEAIKVEDPASGRTLTMLTTEPGLQFYSGQSFDGSVTGYSGKSYVQFGGFVLETQHFPDSPNQPSFPTTELKPGQTLHSTTEFVLGVAK